MNVGTVWAIKCTFWSSEDKQDALKMLYIFNKLHQYFIYQSLTQYTLALRQNIYDYFWNCAITFFFF